MNKRARQKTVLPLQQLAFLALKKEERDVSPFELKVSVLKNVEFNWDNWNFKK